MEQELPSLEWTWQKTLVSIPLGLILFGTIVGNFLVLYSAVSRHRSLSLPTHYFVANLALADFIVGVLCMPFLTTLHLTERWYFGPVYCELWAIFHYWLCSASILSTTAICIERYVGVAFPLHHKEIMNLRKIIMLIVGIWILSGGLALCALYIWPEPKSGKSLTCDINNQIGHVIFAAVAILYIPGITMIILYWKIYRIATKHMKFLRNTNSSFMSSSRYSRSTTRHNGTMTAELPSAPESDAYTTEISFSNSTFYETGDCLDNDASTNDNFRNQDQEDIPSPSVKFISKSPKNLAKHVQCKKQINLARRLSFLVGFLLISYLPYYTLHMIIAFNPVGSIDMRLFCLFVWIRYLNSCFNPFLYACAVPAYRKAIQEIVFNAFSNIKKLVIR